MTSKSLWMSIAVAPQAIPLQGDERCDVVVVGSGIAGLSTAYELSQRGRSVIVIDRGPIAGGMTARTSAHLAPLCDDLMSEMQKIKGEDQSKLFYESQAAAVDRIEEIQKSEGIDCDFRRLDGYLFQGDDMPADVIDEELDAVRAVGAPSSVWSVCLSADATAAMRCVIPGKRHFIRSSIWREWPKPAQSAGFASLPIRPQMKSSKKMAR